MTVGNMRVAVVIPAYRAADTIEKVLAGIPEFVDAVYVVDDASPDDVSERVLAYRDARVQVLVHEDNRGVGGAMMTGYRRALTEHADICVKMDADDQMDPTYLPDLIDPVAAGRADYAKGNRFYDTTALRQMPLVRRIGNAGLAFLIKAASGQWHIFDPTNGYTAVHHTALARVLDLEKLHPRFFFESSMLINLSRVGAVVEDVPIPARYGSQTSNLSIVRTLVEFPGLLLRNCVGRIIRQYFVLDFSAVSLFLLCGIPLVVFGGAFGMYHWIHSYRHGIATPTGTIMLAVLPLILGFQLLLQALVLDVQVARGRPLQIRSRDRREIPVGPSLARTDPRLISGDALSSVSDRTDGPRRVLARLRRFVTAGILAWALYANLDTSARMIHEQVAFVVANPHLSSVEKMRRKMWADGVDFAAFVREHSPNSAVILIPPQKDPWIFSGNRALFSYFVYPRRLVNGPAENSAAAIRSFLRDRPEITHVIVSAEGSPWPSMSFEAPDEVAFGRGGWGLVTLAR